MKKLLCVLIVVIWCMASVAGAEEKYIYIYDYDAWLEEEKKSSPNIENQIKAIEERGKKLEEKARKERSVEIFATPGVQEEIDVYPFLIPRDFHCN